MAERSKEADPKHGITLRDSEESRRGREELAAKTMIPVTRKISKKIGRD